MRLYLCVRTNVILPSSNYNEAVVASHDKEEAYDIVVKLSEGAVDWECSLIAELAKPTVKWGIIVAS